MKKIEEQKNNYIGRLKRIEGQIRGIQQMISDNRLYLDIATQLLSAENALKSLNNQLIKDHLENKILCNLDESQAKEIDEALNWVQKIN